MMRRNSQNPLSQVHCHYVRSLHNFQCFSSVFMFSQTSSMRVLCCFTFVYHKAFNFKCKSFKCSLVWQTSRLNSNCWSVTTAAPLVTRMRHFWFSFPFSIYSKNVMYPLFQTIFNYYFMFQLLSLLSLCLPYPYPYNTENEDLDWNSSGLSSSHQSSRNFHMWLQQFKERWVFKGKSTLGIGETYRPWIRQIRNHDSEKWEAPLYWPFLLCKDCFSEDHCSYRQNEKISSTRIMTVSKESSIKFQCCPI